MMAVARVFLRSAFVLYLGFGIPDVYAKDIDAAPFIAECYRISGMWYGNNEKKWKKDSHYEMKITFDGKETMSTDTALFDYQVVYADKKQVIGVGLWSDNAYTLRISLATSEIFITNQKTMFGPDMSVSAYAGTCAIKMS